jgi:hypothetical protein
MLSVKRLNSPLNMHRVAVGCDDVLVTVSHNTGTVNRPDSSTGGLVGLAEN